MCSLNSSLGDKCSISFPISDFSTNIFSHETEIGEMWGGKDQIHYTQSKELNSGCDLQPFEKKVKDSLRTEYKHWIVSYQKLLSFRSIYMLSHIKFTSTLWVNFDLHHCPQSWFSKKATLKLMEKLDLNAQHMYFSWTNYATMYVVRCD